MSLNMAFWLWLRRVMSRLWGWIGVSSTAIWLASLVPAARPYVDRGFGPNSRLYILIFGLLAFIYSSFLAWRDEAKEIERFNDPSLKLTFNPDSDPTFIRTVLSGAGRRTYIRVLPVTTSRVNRCVGSLLRIERWDGHSWEPTPYSERFSLEWSNNFDDIYSTIEHGTDQFLNICYIPHLGSQIIIPTTVTRDPMQPNNLLREIGPLDASRFWIDYQDSEFRFTVRVTGEPHAGDTIVLSIRRGDTPHQPIVRVLP